MNAVPAALPFGAGTDEIIDGLGKSGMILAGIARRFERLVLWTPTVQGIPLASSPLITEPPEVFHPAVITAWGIHALELATFEAVDLLCRCADTRTLAPGVVIGDDLAYWVQAMRFAGALVARQQYLPGVGMHNDVFRAVWQPVLLGRDTDRLANLASAMPGVARAIHTEASIPPEHATTELLASFVQEVADYLVRAAYAEIAPEHIRRRGAKFEHSTIHSAWLHALRVSDGTLRVSAEE